jgi:hypothetical protein
MGVGVVGKGISSFVCALRRPPGTLYPIRAIDFRVSITIHLEDQTLVRFGVGKGTGFELEGLGNTGGYLGG